MSMNWRERRYFRVWESRLFTLSMILSFMLLFAAACTKEYSTPEEGVRESIEGVIKSVREKDVKAFMGFVSPGYKDLSGNEYRAVKGIIFRQFFIPGELKLFVRDIYVEVIEPEQRRAIVEARVFLLRAGTGESLADTLPKDADGFSFTVEMILEDGVWKAKSAEWEAVGLIGLI